MIEIRISNIETWRYHCTITPPINGMMSLKNGDDFQTGMLLVCIPQSNPQWVYNPVVLIPEKKDFTQ
jgi:hypothetical protein